eukprot:3446-Heterococcus_DN1.PRE.1
MAHAQMLKPLCVKKVRVAAVCSSRHAASKQSTKLTSCCCKVALRAALYVLCSRTAQEAPGRPVFQAKLLKPKDETYSTHSNSQAPLNSGSYSIGAKGTMISKKQHNNEEQQVKGAAALPCTRMFTRTSAYNGMRGKVPPATAVALRRTVCVGSRLVARVLAY